MHALKSATNIAILSHRISRVRVRCNKEPTLSSQTYHGELSFPVRLDVVFSWCNVEPKF